MWLLNATISWFEMGLRPMESMYSVGEFDIIKPKSILFDDNIDMTTSKICTLGVLVGMYPEVFSRI